MNASPLPATGTAPVRLTSHAEVVAAAHNPEVYSSATSRFLHVPNTMDGEVHATFRALVDSYMTPQIVGELEPVFREIADELVRSLPVGREFDAVNDFGAQFAVRAQCAWLGWPAELEGRLLEWMDSNVAAQRSGEPERNAAVAAAFDEIVRERVDAASTDPVLSETVTAQLASELVEGRELHTDEIVSILRNWTAGDLSSLAQCVGVVVAQVLSNEDLHSRVTYLSRREADERGTRELDRIIDECIRINDPFITSKRVTTCPVTGAGGSEIPEGTRVILDWAAANRDPEVFGDPDAFDPDTNAPHNLVYGTGPHVCPGRGLSTMELRVVTRALFGSDHEFSRTGPAWLTAEEPPLGGWAHVKVLFR